MFRFTIRELVLLTLVVNVAFARADEPSVTAGITDIATMVKVVSAQVPAGTAIKDAQRFMEREGFTCEYKKGGWRDERDAYLYCDRREKTSAFFVERVWKVAIFHRNGKVVKVDANTGLVGP